MDLWRREQGTWKMFSTLWRVEDIFPGWTLAKLRDWGASDFELIPMRSDLAALQLGRTLGFSNDLE